MKRKNSVEHLPGMEGAPLRPHAQVRQRMPSPRRSSFHGSESQLEQQQSRQTLEERKKKYATAPITNHDHAARKSRGERPPTLPKAKNMPQAPYQKTFIAILRNRDGRTSKRRSQEIIEGGPPQTPPALPPKPSSGVFYQPLPVGSVPPSAPTQPRLLHAAHHHHQEQFYNTEPLHPPHLEFPQHIPQYQV